jgi:hypothetical protein
MGGRGIVVFLRMLRRVGKGEGDDKGEWREEKGWVGPSSPRNVILGR